MLPSKVIEELKSIVGESGYTDNKIDLVAYSYDAMNTRARPDCAVWVESAEQISRILKLANRENIPVTPRAAGTGIAGMSVPIKGGIVLDVMRMNKILEIRVEDRLVVVQPGVVYADLQKTLAPLGFFFPPDPGSSAVCALGGNVSTNAGGLKAAKYGTTKDYVLGLQVVLPNGEIMRTGTRTMKTSSGYNLTQLFVGAEGTLGVVTEIILKINPLPRAVATAMGVFDDQEKAGRAVSETMASGVIPSILEVMGRRLIQVINEVTDLNLPEVEAILVVETDSFSQADAQAQMEVVVETFRRNGAREVSFARNAQEAEKLWLARKSVHGIVTRINNTFLSEDVTVPLSQLPALFRGFNQIGDKYGLQAVTLAHAGDANFHPLFTFDRTDEDESHRVEQAISELFRLAIDLGGSLSGEHGIGLVKAEYMSLEHDPVEMEVMRGLKRFFDPSNILNPGKMALEA